MVMEDENGYVGLNPPKVYWNKLFHHIKKLCLNTIQTIQLHLSF